MTEEQQAQNNIDELIAKKLDFDSTLTPSERENYKKMLGGGLILISPTPDGDNYMVLSRKDVSEMISQHNVPAERAIWFHPSYGISLETTLGEAYKSYFEDVLDENGDLIEFSADSRMSKLLTPAFSAPLPEETAPTREVEKSAKVATKKEEETEESDDPLIQQIEQDFKDGVITETEREYLISMAEEGELAYVNINGVNQYLTTDYVDYLIQHGTDPELELEVLLSAEGLNDGRKVTLEELKDVLERPDAAASAGEVREDQTPEPPKPAPKKDEEHPETDEDMPDLGRGVDVPDDGEEKPPVLTPEQIAMLGALGSGLPRISDPLSGRWSLKKDLKVEDESPNGGGRSRASDNEGMVQVPSEGPLANSPSQGGVADRGNAPRGGGAGAPGQSPSPASDLPQTSGPKPDAQTQPGGIQDQVDAAQQAQDQEKDLAKQAAQESEEEDQESQERPNRFGNRRPGGKKKKSKLKKVAAISGGAAIGGSALATGATLFGGSADAHLGTIISIISLFV